MTDPSQVTPPSGDQGDQTPGWISALPDEFKQHEFVKTFQKPGDFVKTALEIKTERDGLQAKLANAIFKPGEGEDRAAFNKALGVPDTPEAYEFPKGDGVEHDEAMVGWARQTFHTAGLNTEQAKVISQAWDGFVQGMAQAQEEAVQTGLREAETALKTDWGADYEKNLEETRRAYTTFEAADPKFKELLETDIGNGMKIGNHPVMLKVFHTIGKAMADDTTLTPRPAGGPAPIVGMASIYKVPNPPRN